MKVMSYSESRANYAEVLNTVVDDCEEVVITRSGHDPVVIVSLAEYESMKETSYLLQSSANARVLKERIERLEKGTSVQNELIEEDR